MAMYLNINPFPLAYIAVNQKKVSVIFIALRCAAPNNIKGLVFIANARFLFTFWAPSEVKFTKGIDGQRVTLLLTPSLPSLEQPSKKASTGKAKGCCARGKLSTGHLAEVSGHS